MRGTPQGGWGGGLNGVDTVPMLCNYVPDFCLVEIGQSSQVEMLMCLLSTCLPFLPACIELHSHGWGQCTAGTSQGIHLEPGISGSGQQVQSV